MGRRRTKIKPVPQYTYACTCQSYDHAPNYKPVEVNEEGICVLCGYYAFYTLYHIHCGKFAIHKRERHEKRHGCSRDNRMKVNEDFN